MFIELCGTCYKSNLLSALIARQPLDQSAAYMLGLFPKKNSVFGRFGGNEEDLRGTKRQKLHQILVHFFGVSFAITLG